MEFTEGGRGIYRPIRTPIYDQALKLCWNINSYKSQIALVTQLLMLQEACLIPSQVTSEDMVRFLMEESKSTLRERLWEFELEDFDKEDARPLRKLVWAVNISNKMRDIEFEAQMLLNSSKPLPPKFLHPKVLHRAMEYAKTLRTREAPSSKPLSPQEVVLEVVPRVLQGFWALPCSSLLNMPSQKLSTMSVGVTKAVLDRVTEDLTGVEDEITFSRSIRDDMVLSILTHIRQTHSLDVLVNRIKSFAPVLLSEIVDVAAEQICEMFQPRSPKVPTHLSPAAEPPATAPVQEDLTLTVTPNLETNTAVVSPPPASPAPPAEPPSTDIETSEDEDEYPRLENNPEPTRDPDSAAVPASPAAPPEPPSFDVETREDESDKSSHENDSEPHRDLDSAAVPLIMTPSTETRSTPDVEIKKDEFDTFCAEYDSEPSTDSAAVSPARIPHVEPPSVTDDETSDDKNKFDKDPEPTKEPETTAVVLAPLFPPTELPCISDVQTTDDEHDLEPTREPDSDVTPAPRALLTPPAEPEIITGVQDGLTPSLVVTKQPTSSWSPLSPPLEPVVITVFEEEEKRVQGIFSWFAQPLCCFGVRDTLSALLS